MNYDYDIELLNKFCGRYDYETDTADAMINYAKKEILTNFQPDFQKFFEEEALYTDYIYTDENGDIVERTSNKTPEESERFYSNINTIKHHALLAAYDLYCAEVDDDYIVSSYNLGRYMGLIGNYEKIKSKRSKAGKAKGKTYESTKQKVFEYAQNLLNKSKTKYTANALADKITNAYLLGDMQGIRFDAENPKTTIYRWLKNEFPSFQNNEKKI